ncbi:glycolate oxidase subunit GlcE [Mesorhizobium australicum]|uniref:Glycolate oxidase FAD binding subunit n=1 Tax=Mesorhizobium australicum TaxID=536018 RepID=A0A1X7NPC8_9HYPH|nr:glycolate oxidase subunit GlcE [Mesorhizobium australicum]SMH39859.1 glycolate oxidase FAD binding subunit [Mesorhizobium australicum]
MTTFTPTTAAEVLDAVRWAAAEEQPLEIVGRGTKRGIGRPAQTKHAVDLSGLTGVTLYEPEELVLSARAGTPLAEIEALLAGRGQELAFEPMDYAPLLTGKTSSDGKSGTVGGALAANLSGPRRLKAGAARDHILGVHAVSGRGEAFKAGGRVVKNVTGYDLSKAMAGSWGTLAVVTDLTFKVLPRAETETTVALRRLDDEKAVAAMAAAMGSSAEVSAAAHLPELVAARVAGGTLGSDPATLLRVDGFGPSVAYRVAMLSDLFGGHVETIDTERSRALWVGVRDVAPFADGTDRPVWRISLAPSEGWKLVAALRMQLAVDAFYDWQGGLVWLRLEDDPEAELVRRLVRGLGSGHATLVRASAPVRAAIPVFEPQHGALGALSARLKSEFDPRGILNPGRMATV